MIKYHLSYDLKILFVGINPHPGSDSRGVPFSNNKMFWYLLHDAGLISETREELRNDATLQKLYKNALTQEYHFGIINLVDRPTRSVVVLKRNEALPGRKRLIAAIHRYKPGIVCFVGKITYAMFAGTKTCTYGWQPPIAASKVYVMHSPSHGLALVRIQELQKLNDASKQEKSD